MVFLMPILPGTDGVRRMGKSLGNYIALEDTPTDMFGKIMSLPDDVVPLYFELLTDISEAEVEEIKQAAGAGGGGAMELKKRLGVEMVSWFHTAAEAEAAKAGFERTVQNRQAPEDVPEFAISAGTDGVDSVDGDGFSADVSRLLVATGLASSRSEARRLLQQDAVEIDGERAADSVARVAFGSTIRAGRRRYVRVVKG